MEAVFSKARYIQKIHLYYYIHFCHLSVMKYCEQNINITEIND